MLRKDSCRVLHPIRISCLVTRLPMNTWEVSNDGIKASPHNWLPAQTHVLNLRFHPKPLGFLCTFTVWARGLRGARKKCKSSNFL